MDSLILRIVPRSRDYEMQELQLHPHKIESSIVENAAISKALLYNDVSYSACITPAEEISSLTILINGNSIDIHFDRNTGDILFVDESFGDRIFSECFGYVQFTVICSINNSDKVLETDYVQIMVKKCARNESIRKMADYVYQNNQFLMYGEKGYARDVAGLRNGAKNTLETKLLLLKKISLYFEENYRYFKANSRFKTVPKEQVDYFEKLQFVSNRTIHYIAQHPEELREIHGHKGVIVGNKRYQPVKTLITSNSKSFDIYENQVLIGFLHCLYKELETLEADTLKAISKSQIKTIDDNEYISSSIFIFVSTIETLNNVLRDIRLLEDKYRGLIALYSKLLDVKPIAVLQAPRYTPIFKSVPQYHQLYDCISSWFLSGPMTLEKESFMLSFTKISVLYELYALSKILNHFTGVGFILSSVEKVEYPVSNTAFYSSCNYNNKFTFVSGDKTVTVYYQPVIFSYDRSDISGIGLYRNTSICYPKDDDNFLKGKMYTPDFIIKYEDSSVIGAKYLICDAKYSSMYFVKGKEIPKLSFKYLFSVSCTNKDDEVAGLCIIHGVSDSDVDGVHSAYDYGPRTDIRPIAEILTLTENDGNTFTRHKELLNWVLFGCVDSKSGLKRPAIIEQTETYITETDTANELTVLPESASKSRRKNKGSKEKKNPLELQLDKLNLDSSTKELLEHLGYSVVGDMLPNLKKKELTCIHELNRAQRRAIESELKKHAIRLT